MAKDKCRFEAESLSRDTISRSRLRNRSPSHHSDDRGYDLEGCFPDFTDKPGTEGLACRWAPERGPAYKGSPALPVDQINRLERTKPDH